MKKLHTLIPPDSAQLFDRRKSPSANITVLNISSGNLGPGYSGAPVLNSNNNVVGVLDGGLRSGALAISWAIPITYVEWRDISSARALVDELSNLDTSKLFFLEEYRGPVTDRYTYQISGSINGIPIYSVNGIPEYMETSSHKVLFPYQGGLSDFRFTVKQFTNGKLCDTGMILSDPSQTKTSFPRKSTNSDVGEPRTCFAGGVMGKGQNLLLLLNPGTTCQDARDYKQLCPSSHIDE